MTDIHTLNTVLKYEFKRSGVIIPPPPLFMAGGFGLLKNNDGQEVCEIILID